MGRARKARPIATFPAWIEGVTEDMLEGVVDEVFKRVREKTPVLTGEARASWQKKVDKKAGSGRVWSKWPGLNVLEFGWYRSKRGRSFKRTEHAMQRKTLQEADEIMNIAVTKANDKNA